MASQSQHIEDEDVQMKEEEELKKQEEIFRQKELEEEVKKEKLAMSLSNLPEEPAQDDKSAVKLAMKMPTGERVERRFSKDDKVQTLYDFVDSL